MKECKYYFEISSSLVLLFYLFTVIIIGMIQWVKNILPTFFICVLILIGNCLLVKRFTNKVFECIAECFFFNFTIYNLIFISDSYIHTFTFFSVKDEPQEEQNETLHNNFNNFETIQKATNSLRNYSTPRDFICMSPESTHMSYTNSPTNTLNKGHHCRPSPPPYVRPKYKPEFWPEVEAGETRYC